MKKTIIYLSVFMGLLACAEINYTFDDPASKNPDATKKGSEEPEPTPVPNTEPKPDEQPVPADKLEPTYASIKKNIFDRSCVGCHTQGGKKADVDLDSLEAMLQWSTVEGEEPNLTTKRLLDLDKPELSVLIAIVSPNAEGKVRMPTKKSGLPYLTEDEIKVLVQWIQLKTPK